MTTTQQLEKASRTLSNHIRRGATSAAYRSQQLIDRYNELRSAAIHEGVWEAFCAGRGFCPTHDGCDFFA